MTGPGPYKPPRYKPRGWGEELRRRQHNAGMSAWELADLLGVHEHDISLDHLPNQPLHVVLELACRLDLHPGDRTRYAAQVYDHPRYFDAQFPAEPAPGSEGRRRFVHGLSNRPDQLPVRQLKEPVAVVFAQGSVMGDDHDRPREPLHRLEELFDEQQAEVVGGFLEHGFEAVTIAEIAAAAQVAKMTVTNYFPRKEDLALDFHETFRGSLAAAVASRRAGESALNGLRREYLAAVARQDALASFCGPAFAR
ncbi:TetR family transcriptional regulator [Streptomyces sp. NPDC057545]|uniref:TetR family transcriptional regulator n=1 Tax=Streptomyces sp. NPDC057545 TaxID=3346164 RepID=UPI0036B992DA